jgi:hypothetical protein
LRFLVLSHCWKPFHRICLLSLCCMFCYFFFAIVPDWDFFYFLFAVGPDWDFSTFSLLLYRAWLRLFQLSLCCGPDWDFFYFSLCCRPWLKFFYFLFAVGPDWDFFYFLFAVVLIETFSPFSLL